MKSLPKYYSYFSMVRDCHVVLERTSGLFDKVREINLKDDAEARLMIELLIEEDKK